MVLVLHLPNDVDLPNIFFMCLFPFVCLLWTSICLVPLPLFNWIIFSSLLLLENSSQISPYQYMIYKYLSHCMGVFSFSLQCPLKLETFYKFELQSIVLILLLVLF